MLKTPIFVIENCKEVIR